MLTLFRWLVRLTIGLILGGVAAALLVWYFAVRSLPDYDAQLTLAGLSQPVEIVRTTENVPHILAQTDRDAFFALGFVHAQDRLFQMMVMRRAAQGRLAEIYGPRAYGSDDLARRLGLWRNAQSSVAAQDDRTQAALLAYADGVNAWVEQVNKGALGRGAPEFFLMPGDIAYWQPADSLAILKLIAAGATAQLGAEVTRAQVSLAAPARADDLVGGAGEPPLPGYAALFGDGARFQPRVTDAETDWFDALAGYVPLGRGASANGFAADAGRTAAGAPLLANDPQMALTAPSLWYLARMDLASGAVIGGTIPGIPAVLSGRNPTMAWGLTPAWVDDQDIVMEEVQPGAPDRYLSDGGWADFTTRHEVIRVRDAEDRRITLRDTDAGPVIPPAHFGLGSVTPAGYVPALRWTGLSAADTTMSALIGLMESPDRPAAAQAVQGVIAPAIEVTLADQGGVSQILAGEIPRRPADHPTAGRMPAPGRLAAARWETPVPPDAPQRLTAPSGGIVAATGAEPGGFAGNTAAVAPVSAGQGAGAAGGGAAVAAAQSADAASVATQPAATQPTDAAATGTQPSATAPPADAATAPAASSTTAQPAGGSTAAASSAASAPPADAATASADSSAASPAAAPPTSAPPPRNSALAPAPIGTLPPVATAATSAPATAAPPPATAFALGHDRDDPLRLQRLNRLLAGREIHSRDSFIDAQLDTVSPAARALLPLVGADLWFTGDPAAPGTPERQRQQALALLAEWDGNMGEHLPEPLIYAAWMHHLQDRLIHDELGALASTLSGRLRPAFIDRVFRNTGGAASWCDVVQSAPVEDCATIARQSLDAALIDLSARFGSDVASWRWGDVHQSRHEHPALGRMPVIGWIVSLVQSTSGDGASLARAATLGALSTGGTANPWQAVTGAGYRGVYDLADPDSSVFVISTGQSGHPLSRHYDDLSERWRRGEYIGMSLDPTLARAGASGVTVLTPAQ